MVLSKMTSYFQQILNSIPAGIIVADTSGKIIYVNDASIERMAMADYKIPGAHISSVSKKLERMLKEFIGSWKPIYHEHVSLKAKLFNVEISPVMMNEVPEYVLFYFIEQNVVRSNPIGMSDQAYLRLQFDSSFKFANIGMWIIDRRGVVLKVNTAAKKLIGVTEKEVIGKKITELVKKGVIDQALTPQILQSKKPLTRLLHVLKRDKFVMSSGVPVLDRDDNILFVVVNELDITMLKKLQGKLDRLSMVAERYKNELTDLNLQELKQHGIIAESKEMKQVLQVALKIAHLKISDILILGESGTGKGLIAQFIHNSYRKNKPFVQINCAALPESLLEAELFGYERGAFTGAGKNGKIGLFEMAQDGTILLDEIGDLPLSVQSKLLKCLDDHELLHLGGLRPIKINCTIIAATNRDLKTRVKENKFREDLFFRLNSFQIEIPPLRKRPEDIVALTDFYLNEYNREFKMNKRLSLEVVNELKHYAFPGNVRELKNILKHAVVMNENNLIDSIISQKTETGTSYERWLSALNESNDNNLNELLKDFESSVLKHAMERCRSTRKMAAYLGTSQSRIARLLKKHHMSTTSGRQ